MSDNLVTLFHEDVTESPLPDDTATTFEIADVSDIDGKAPVVLALYQKTAGTPKDSKDLGRFEFVRIADNGDINSGANEITVTRGYGSTTAQDMNTIGGVWSVYNFMTPEMYGSKVATSDIVDNLTSTDTDKPLSANQGKNLQDDKAPLSAINNDPDFYEEGFWTPEIIGTGGGSATYGTVEGDYIRTGNFVFLSATISFDIATLSGDIRVANLPFIQKNDSSYFNNSVMMLRLTTALSDLFLQAIRGSTEISLYKENNGTDTHNTMENTDFTDNTIIRFTYSYIRE